MTSSSSLVSVKNSLKPERSHFETVLTQGSLLPLS